MVEERQVLGRNEVLVVGGDVPRPDPDRLRELGDRARGGGGTSCGANDRRVTGSRDRQCIDWRDRRFHCRPAVAALAMVSKRGSADVGDRRDYKRGCEERQGTDDGASYSECHVGRISQE